MTVNLREYLLTVKTKLRKQWYTNSTPLIIIIIVEEEILWLDIDSKRDTISVKKEKQKTSNWLKIEITFWNNDSRAVIITCYHRPCMYVWGWGWTRGKSKGRTWSQAAGRRWVVVTAAGWRQSRGPHCCCYRHCWWWPRWWWQVGVGWTTLGGF